ncbi:hypercellular protein HypA [Blastomyces gilchristii SLH14081]|uniref:Hypercellular protein HypA n=1 Tax=Blastomyces gilchristii (strain SLH14081) TaxID=559298 RepID=A0A179UYW2_BLAGS|nr:hypercellular protein HypA [Blastomyces gilchristii SLH14081]OAT12409.1 hypercellular protein HypA [Blastomyces gilchristii SLH14081]
MAVDPLSPVAPARLRALLLPVGKIKRSRFLNLVKRLQAQNVVRLGDVSPDGRPNRNSFSPMAFPTGMVVYDLSISVPPISHLDLYPFEIFREPLAIIAIADGAELPNEPTGTEPSSQAQSNGTKVRKYPRVEGLKGLQQELNALKDSYPRSLVQQLLIFDYAGVENLITGPDTVVWVPRPEAARSTTVKTVMCDITSRLLGELSGLAERMQEWPTVESPKASSWGPRRTPDVRPAAPNKLQHRMTMPAQMPGANGTFINASDTNFQPAEHDSPTTFDEITRSIQLSNRVTSSIKSSPKPGSKEHSRERMSVHGLGFVGASERSKNRVKGRLNIVMGTLFLQAGRWPDSLKELAEGAAIARANSDYIWHAKALESILQCLLMLGWAGMDFRIPQICYPSADKFSKSVSQTPSMSLTELYNIGQSNPESRIVSLQNLANLLPDLSNNILHLYTRAANITDEPVPQLVFSETVIRLARILATIYIRDGSLDDNALGNIVMNDLLKFVRSPERPRGAVSLRKSDIASFLFRALPHSLGTDVPVTDSSPILVGMASVLSSLGLDRKKAFVLQQLFTILIPGLVQARKIGAAEVGIHPAAGLSSLNHSAFEINALDIGPENMDESVRILLAVVGTTYGVPGTMMCDDKQQGLSRQNSSTTRDIVPEYDSVDSIVDRAFRHSAIHGFGDHSLKVEILKACINFCEALPDFQGVLQFTVDLLQTIKGTLMLPPDSYRGHPLLPIQDQVRLFNNVKRTVAAAKKLGDSHLEAEYWDDFLVRGVELVNLSDFKEPVRRSRTDFGFANVEERLEKKNPFIYSAFSKTTTRRSENLLIAEEQATFKVTLQNPFEFDVEIERLRIDGTGVSFEAAATYGLWLAPFTTQDYFISGLATTEGTLEITGCTVKVKFCRERRFPIFKNFWKPQKEQKIKRTGLAAKEPFSERPLSWSSNASGSRSGAIQKGPERDIVHAKVIKKQPTVIIQSTSLSQSAIMLLEGETRSFDITLQNISTCPLDFLSFSFEDSTTRQLESALTNKENLPTDIYELELRLSTNPALSWRRDNLSQSQLSIAAGETATFTIDVYGKPGLDNALVKIDYAHVCTSLSDLPETFYCRQISLPLTVTVNTSVDVTRCDVLPLTGDFAWANNKLQHGEDSRAATGDKESIKSMELSSTPRSITQLRETQFSHTLSRLDLDSCGFGHCVLLLDLRNAWPNPLTVSLFVDERSSDDVTNTDNRPRQDMIGIHEVYDELQPGHASRFVLVVPRVYLENPEKPIPSLNVSNKRQFVVSANKLSYEAESSAREVFWFREELLKRLRGSWKDETTGREGAVDLRAIRLNARMVDALRVESVDVAFSLRPYASGIASDDNTSETDNESVTQMGHSKFIVRTNTFLTLSATIINRSSKPIHPLLRLQPSLRHTPHAVALDLSKRLAWSGMLQRALPILEPYQTTEVTLGITALCRGDYEISASVEEIRRLKQHSAAPGATVGQGQEAAEDVNGDVVAAAAAEDPYFDNFFITNTPKHRRIWHSRVPCMISARD